MSKIGKKPVVVSDQAQVSLDKDRALIKGPRGEVVVAIPDGIKVSLEDNQLLVSCWRHDKKTRSCFGTTRSLLDNAVVGVTVGWQKELEVVGTGYKVSLQSGKLIFTLGFSHPVEKKTPENLEVSVEGNKITIKGADRQKVGLFAAQIRKISPPDVYKGKGIRYSDEEIKLKPGKIAKAAGAVV